MRILASDGMDKSAAAALTSRGTKLYRSFMSLTRWQKRLRNSMF